MVNGRLSVSWPLFTLHIKEIHGKDFHAPNYLVRLKLKFICTENVQFSLFKKSAWNNKLSKYD